jgi:hypothetical protein
MDEDDIKHIRDSTIITQFQLNDEGEVKDFFLTKVPNVVVIRIYSDRLCMKMWNSYVHVYSQRPITKYTCRSYSSH